MFRVVSNHRALIALALAGTVLTTGAIAHAAPAQKPDFNPEP
nr:hypothetical protein [uncultured Caulobacter sp.]